jgi:hypothetical protein
LVVANRTLVDGTLACKSAFKSAKLLLVIKRFVFMDIFNQRLVIDTNVVFEGLTKQENK